MGDIVRRGTKDRPRFYMRYVELDGQRVQRVAKGAQTIGEARTLLAAAEIRVAQGSVGMIERRVASEAERSRATITIEKLAARFLGDVDDVAGFSSPRIKRMQQYRNAQRTVIARITPLLGSRIAAEVTRVDVEHFRDALEPDFAAASISNTIATLSKVYEWAIRAGEIACPNPCRGVERPRGDAALDYFSANEVGAIIALAEARAREPSASTDAVALPVAISLAVFAGLRKGEIAGLRWQDVHLDVARLDVMRSYRTLPKGGKPRYLPMHADLVRTLRAWRTRCPATDEALVLPVRTDSKRGRFHMLESQDMLDLPAALEAAGCRAPGRPWHTLRHTFASSFMMAGGNILTLQKLLGHADVTTTMIYAHLSPDHLAGEVARLSFPAPVAAEVTNIATGQRNAS